MKIFSLLEVERVDNLSLYSMLLTYFLEALAVVVFVNLALLAVGDPLVGWFTDTLIIVSMTVFGYLGSWSRNRKRNKANHQ